MTPIYLPDSTEREFGYSLLEMLVVLAILSLVISVVSVPIVGTIDRVKFSQQSQKIIAEIKYIRTQAIINQRPTIVNISDSYSNSASSNVYHVALPLPYQWQASGKNIKISANGYCTGGRILLINPDRRRIEYVLTEPKCALVK